MPRTPIRTKIVCTIGTEGERAETACLARYLEAGMDVARVNMSHSEGFRREGPYVRGESYEADRWRLNNLRAASRQTGVPLAILGDLQGPKVRLGRFSEASVPLKQGQAFTFWRDADRLGDAHGAPLQYFDEVVARAVPLTEVWLADGLVQLTVSEVRREQGEIVAIVSTEGRVSSNQGAIFKGIEVTLPHLTEKDRSDLAFLCDAPVDFIALSFLKTPADVAAVREAMGSSRIPLIAKIETAEALHNLDALLRVVDGAMVARGDLGVRLPIEEVPLAQKTIIERCNVLALPVITATQMLDSMETRPIPTRAEATDVANAILDGTDAVMLSGETAKGDFALQAIRTLVAIAARVERGRETDQPNLRLTYKERNFKLAQAMRTLKESGGYPDSEDRAVGDAIARAAADIAEELGLEVMLCPTASGGTARLVARYRPTARILAAVEDQTVARQLLLSYGVTPLFFEAPANATDHEMLEAARLAAVAAGMLKTGERFLFTAGHPLREPGSTNMVTVYRG